MLDEENAPSYMTKSKYIHRDLVDNLDDIFNLTTAIGMDRSLQAEGTFGWIKWKKGYKRLHRRGIEGVILELGLISCGLTLISTI